MNIIKREYFVPIIKYRHADIVEEITEKAHNDGIKIFAKEVVVVIFLYVLIASFLILVGAYIYMASIDSPGADGIKDMIQYCGAALGGYLFGVNKNT